MTTTNRFSDAPTLIELISGVASGAQELANAHAQQLRDEVTSELAHAKSALILLGGGVVTGFAGFTFVMIAIVQVLIEVVGWPSWAAWLSVGGVFFLIGGITFAVGVNTWNTVRAIPDRTIRSIQESLSWINN